MTTSRTTELSIEAEGLRTQEMLLNMGPQHPNERCRRHHRQHRFLDGRCGPVKQELGEVCLLHCHRHIIYIKIGCLNPVACVGATEENRHCLALVRCQRG
jgi:hypothetical protein